MSTYCIGDVQGCLTELESLLKIINYNHNKDSLWFVGDLVNRGPQSLETLRFIKQQPNTKIVLGNHDIHLISFYHDIVDFETEHLESIITAKDGKKLVTWLQKQPLAYYSREYNCLLTHAGVYPGWGLNSALGYANEAANALSNKEFLKNMYGNKPKKWDNNLTGYDRLRFIINAFTRMRFCDLEGNLNFQHSGKIESAPKEYIPWFKIPWRKTKEIKIIFGHWAALEGKTDEPNATAIDTGCVWGKKLTALRLDDNNIFSYKCEQK